MSADNIPSNQRFLAAEEDLVAPYKFGVYDLLVLPGSFPFGGMVKRFFFFDRLGADQRDTRKMLAYRF